MKWQWWTTSRAGKLLHGRLRTILLVAVSLLGGAVLYAVFTPQDNPAATVSASNGEATVWTCSMHPQIRAEEPGRCPICSMDLIPLKGSAGREAVFTTTSQAKALMGIRTSPVERTFVTATIRMVGKVRYDETRLATITAWVPGRLDRLYVDYTGVPVREGDHMVLIYSPELLVAQEELLQAKRAIENLRNSDVDIVMESSRAAYQAAREKLRLYGLSEKQIQQIESSGQASEKLVLNSPESGIVIHKHAEEGMYVKTGTTIYTIADLTTMWVMLDAYESDLPWLRYGQDVSFTTVAQPGEVFTGRIAFIDPVVDPTTQTIKVRVNVPNPQGRLKPGMFVKAIARSELAAGGRVMSADMAGKFICPMHPSIVKDHQGQCDICQMDLVATESLGYESPSEDALTPPLVIPASAPLVTGKRAIVYVELPQADQPTFEGRQIVLGPRAGEYYLVRQGLREGERVVTRGNFKIDSALQIEARPSMMSADEPPSLPTPSGQKPQPVPESFRKSLAEVLRAYLSLGEALAGDQLDLARQEAVQLTSAIRGVDAGRLSPSTRQIWERTAEILNTAGEQIAEAETLQAAREPFSPASNALAGLLRQVGLPGKEPLYEMKCPMAFDNRGANWLQRDPDVTNPYFGEAMFRCGEIVDTLPPTGTGSGEQDHGAHDHE